jgi:hypothetical protein
MPGRDRLSLVPNDLNSADQRLQRRGQRQPGCRSALLPGLAQRALATQPATLLAQLSTECVSGEPVLRAVRAAHRFNTETARSMKAAIATRPESSDGIICVRISALNGTGEARPKMTIARTTKLDATNASAHGGVLLRTLVAFAPGCSRRRAARRKPNSRWAVYAWWHTGI